MRAVILLVLCLLFSESTSSSCLYAQAKRENDKLVKALEKEKRKLDRNTNPAARARSLMRIAEIKLSFVTEAADTSDFPKMQEYIEQYRQAVTEARGSMMGSGWDPQKKSGGYKAVEIGLRKQMRWLKDIAQQLTVDERRPVDHTIDFVTSVRAEFLDALFDR